MVRFDVEQKVGGQWDEGKTESGRGGPHVTCSMFKFVNQRNSSGVNLKVVLCKSG